MKNLFVLIFLLGTFNAFTATSPFPPYLEDRFVINESAIDVVEADVAAIEASDQEVVKIATIDVPASSTATDIGLTIPAGSFITFVGLTVSATTSETSLSLGCESATDLLNAADLSALTVNQTATGSQTGATNTWIYSDGCPVKIKAAGTSGTGLFKLLIKYFTP
jgi:hypothetical protein